MKGDFSRVTFRSEKHYSSVRMQQGRVQLDADWNEAMDIIEHRNVVQAVDVIGQTGAPQGNAAFGIIVSDAQVAAADRERLKERNLLPSQLHQGDFLLSPGRFYVDGILCEVEDFVPFTAQPDLPGQAPLEQHGVYLVYLDVWPWHRDALADPSMREVALGGPDTTTRVKTVWQVKAMRVDQESVTGCSSAIPDWDALIAPSTGKLSARAKPGDDSAGPCIVPAGAGYRRLENQLYRVEIHEVQENGTVTYKWSRDNGSVTAQVTGVLGSTQFQISSLGHDTVTGFAAGQWIEFTADSYEQQGQPGVFALISSVNGQVLNLDRSVSGFGVGARVRRWDFTGTDGPPAVSYPMGNDGFIALDDSGVEIKFQAGTFKTGDYWLIPARTLTSSVEWPYSEPRPPAGIRHHYCRLGLVRSQPADTASGWVTTLLSDCRVLFPPLAEAGIHVLGVQAYVPNSDGSPVVTPLHYDDQLPLNQFAELHVLLDQAADNAALAGKPTCTLTVQTPFPLVELALAGKLDNRTNSMYSHLSGLGATVHEPSGAEVNPLNPLNPPNLTIMAAATRVPTFGYRPLVLAGNATASGLSIIWQPDTQVLQLVEAILRLMIQYSGIDRPQLLAELNLKGNFIWAADHPERYLDGDTFAGVPLPSGDNRRGGDFSFWFWLTLPQ